MSPTTASFTSVLFDLPQERPTAPDQPLPAFFADLRLDQVVASLTRGRADYRLEPIFAVPLRRVESISYRHQVFRDLQTAPLRAQVQRFAARMRTMRDQLARMDKLHYPRQRQRWFLDAADTYTQAVTALAADLNSSRVTSRALHGLRQYLDDYVASPSFATLLGDIAEVQADLAGVAYTMNIRGDRIRVSRYDGQADYSAHVLATFERFAQGMAKDYRVKQASSVEMNHVEAAVLDLVARLYPQAFTRLQDFGRRHRDYLDQVVVDVDRELQFYLAYLEYIEPLSRAGLRFCYPQVSATAKQVHARDTFDLALADKLVTAGRPVVCNDFGLRGPERVIVVTGPNQGGKSTFARAFGQLHHLARLGCPVPGADAGLLLCDQVFTHFEKGEDVANLRGKLEDDLLRIRHILTQATGSSIVILNEIFTSTALADALLLGGNVLTELIAKDVLCVCVTFVDEWASLGPSTVSMVSAVAAHDPSVRTFKVVRRAADGRSYAASIAEKYGLSYSRLRERIRP